MDKNAIENMQNKSFFRIYVMPFFDKFYGLKCTE